MKAIRLLLRVAPCLVVMLGACTRQDVGAPNVLIVVIDALRADRLGAYGNPRGLTPFLDRLAARGTVFRNAYAVSSWTPPSVASLFTSRYPSQHHVIRGDSILSEEEVTLADELAPRYATAGFSANLRLAGELGFGQGFARWVVYPKGQKKPRGATLRTDALAWVDETCRPATPCALYLQYMEAHAPYEPPEPYRARFGREAQGADIVKANRQVVTFPLGQPTAAEVELLASYYDAEVAAVDEEIRLLFAELEARRFLDNAIVIVAADHGEEFREHDWMAHGTALYNETIKVPLILLAPGFQGGRVVETNVSLLDVAPTLLELVGLPQQPRFEGHSLVPLLKRRSFLPWLASATKQPDRGDILMELGATETPIDYRRHTAGIVRDSMTLLVNQEFETTELYDVANDPHQAHPIANGDGRLVVLQQALNGRRDDLQQRGGKRSERRALDPATKEKLRALGYNF